MSRKSLPAWQQVVLTALENVPKAKNGRDAWEKLIPEEQAAVIDFLTEHCGEDKAQGALEETWKEFKPRILPHWAEKIFGFAFVVMLVIRLEFGLNVVSFVVWVLALCIGVVSMIRDDRSARLAEIWRKRSENSQGPGRVLELMHNVTQLSWWEENMWGLLWYAVYVVLFILTWIW